MNVGSIRISTARFYAAIKEFFPGIVILRQGLVSILMVDTSDGMNTVVIFNGLGTFASYDDSASRRLAYKA